MKLGKVFLVGAGPSDVGLFTLKGKAVLESADVVVYDALVGQEVLRLMPEAARKIDVGKRAGNHPVPQPEINQILLDEALAGNTVVRLKGGDPFLFGRGGEELELLAQCHVPFEVVPGVTSALSVPAYAGIPVTHRDFCSSVHIITGHTKQFAQAETDFKAMTRLGGTLVFLMGVGALKSICDGLISAGMPDDMPAAILERGTTASQRRVVATLRDLPRRAQEERIGPPAVIVVGKVCTLAERFAWAEKRPLGGARVLVTRPKARASRFVEALRRQGAEVVELPSIRTEPLSPNPALDAELDRLPSYGWLAFTSPAGVETFFNHLKTARKDVRCLGGVKLAAIGSATAKELEDRGLLPDLVPQTYSAAALGALLAREAQGQAVLIARARQGSPDLTAALDAAQVPYTDLPIYETVYEDSGAQRVAGLLEAGEIDYVAFTSASTVHGFVRTLGKRGCSKLRAACIGEATAQAARDYGMKVSVAREASIAGMVELLIVLRKEECER